MRGLMQVLQLLKQYLRNQVGQVIGLSVLLLGGIALQLINPQVVRYFLDSAETGGTLNQLFRAAALFICIALLRQCLNLGAAYVSELVAWTATNALRLDLTQHCLNLGMDFHKTHKPGELIERVDGDVNQLANFFSRLIIQLTGNALLLLGVMVFLWVIEWRVGLSVFLLVILSIFAVNWLRKFTIPRWEAVRQSNSELFGYVEEWLNGTEVIRSNKAEPYIMNQLYHYLRDRWLKANRAQLLNVFVVGTPMLTFSLAYCAAYIWGSFFYEEGRFTIGTVYLIFYYIDLMRGPLFDTMRQVEELQRASASINRIVDLFAMQPSLQDGPGLDFPSGPLGVNFDDVAFAYADDPDTLILQDIDFVLAPGKILGLLGRTGSGKSTLSKLLFRFYDPLEGEIRLGGQNLAQAKQAALRQKVGMVTQEVQLFHASIRDNLTLFDDQNWG